MIAAAEGEVVRALAAAELVLSGLVDRERFGLAGCPFMAAVAEEAVLAPAAHAEGIALSCFESYTCGFVEKDDRIVAHSHSFGVSTKYTANFCY